MADVWEKDLAQKTSLTTSDFIRVVGSDNVSYKQGMTSVKSTLGVTALENKFTLIPSGSDLNDYHATGFYAIQTSSTNVQNCPSGYSALIVIGASATGTAHQMCYNNSGIWKRSYTGNPATWTDWEKTPTRAEVDALASDSGWIELKTGVKYRKVGKICYVNIEGYTATQTSGTETIGTLPTGYRPSMNIQWCTRKGTSTLTGGWVTNTGNINYTAVSASGTVAGFISFPVG